MGSGASSLSTEQKASIAKELKERYESLDPSEQPAAQADLMKHYEELVAKAQQEQQQGQQQEQQGPVGLQVPRKPRKKLARMRSFENGNFLLENVAHPKKEKEAPDQDFWDSVSTQPKCLVCKMVFSSESKRDTHMKYSEVHAKNVEALAALEKLKENLSEGDSGVKVVPPEAPSFRCRELYSGSKFYWRLRDTIEYHLYLHLDSNCIEVIPYDNHAQKEYDRLYFDEGKLFALVGPDKVAEKVKERLAALEKSEDSEKLSPDDLMADERRQAVVTLLMSKLQLNIPDMATNVKVVQFKMTVDGSQNPLLPAAPDDVKPVLVKRRRLSTTQEIEAALLAASESEVQINVKLTEAEQLLNMARV